ncbi:MAG: hypothetical protein ACOCXJ_04630 [Planctomycetota bacterium]
MATVHEDFQAQRDALIDYLYAASSDGLGPETIVCRDLDQAMELMDVLLLVQNSGKDPSICAVRHGLRVTLWLTDAGADRGRARAGRPLCLTYQAE